jgi:hypothetical protein
LNGGQTADKKADAMVEALNWLIILAFLGLVVVVGWLIATLVNLKNHAVGDAKRFYERPVERINNITATGKGIAQQETVRVKRIIARVKVAAVPVQAVVAEARTAADILKESDIQGSMTKLQEIVTLAMAFSKVVQEASRAK